jgi:SAM-dependent methyltransferase
LRDGLLYDRIGGAYAKTRRPDPRIARMIRAALGDAASVVNIGAGSGSYEPTGLAVVPVEPSELMIRQRPPSLAPAVRGAAEALPLPDKSVDAALAVLTAHHWADRPAAFAEIRRVARKRAVFFTHDPDAAFGWLDDYFPGLAGSRYPRMDEFEVLGRVTVEPVLVPADCTDGFTAAYWRRPDAYLDEAMRANMSTFALLDDRLVADGAARLSRDLADRSWHSRYASLLSLPELDVGYRLVVAELG